MKLCAWRDDVDVSDARFLLSKIPGDREAVWSAVVPHLLPGRELKASYAKGFAWLDRAMKERGAADFVSASPAQQTELVDLIAYRRNASPELTPGIEFFTLVRRMTVDACYTSPIGIKDIDYRGNTPIGSYPAPTESIAYALKRSKLG